MKKRVFCILLACVTALALAPVSAGAAGGVTIKKTDIQADRVFNTGEGYGSLTLNDDSAGYGYSRIALIDRTGTILFPYSDVYYGNYYVSDGIVSRVTNDLYSPFFKQEYYHLDGTLAFDTGSYGSGTPMLNGYAIVYPPIWLSDDQDPKNPCIIDDTGKAVYTFPDEFSELVALGDGFLTQHSVGWCREQLTGGGVGETAPVLVAEYDGSGRMLGVTAVTESGRETAVSKQAGQVRLFWVTQTSIPKCSHAVIGD